MPAAAAIPYIASAAGSYFASKANSSATTPNATEQAASAGQTGAAGTLNKNASALSGIGLPALQQSGGYFSQLAGGNRATMTQALAPDIENINSVYGGTARTLSRFLRPGPTQGVQLAESERDRAGQIGSLFRNARPQANSALANIGGSAISGSTSAATGAGGIFGQQAGQAQASRFGGAGLDFQSGQAFGGLLFNLLKQYSGGKTSGGNQGIGAPGSPGSNTPGNWLTGGDA